jgi:hypothetical protein
MDKRVTITTREGEGREKDIMQNITNGNLIRKKFKNDRSRR